jgi:hypothetical protein
VTNEEKILALLALIAQQAGENVSQQRLDFICERLSGMDLEKAVVALNRLAESARRFPTVEEIRQAMGESITERDEGLLIANRINRAIEKFGDPGPGNITAAKAIKDFCGPSVWDVVNSSGGWQTILQRAEDNLSAFTAQIRDSASALIKCRVIEPGQVPTHDKPASELIQQARASLFLEQQEKPRELEG